MNRELDHQVWSARQPSEGHDEQLFRIPVQLQIEQGTQFDFEDDMRIRSH